MTSTVPQRRLEVVDVALHGGAVVGDRARAHPLDALARRRRAAGVLAVLDEVAALADLDRLDGVVALVVLGERLAVEVGRELVHAGQVDRPLLDPAHAVVEVGDPADLAELAVVDEVEADVGLAADDVGDRRGQLGVESRPVVRLAVGDLLEIGRERVRPDEAAHVSGEDLGHGSLRPKR